MSTAAPDAKALRERAKQLRERAKQLAEQRRAEAKARKRRCALCGVEENEKMPFVAHPDGIGPSCRELATCESNRAAAARPAPLR